MKKILVFSLFTVLFFTTLLAQQPERKPMPAVDRAKSTVERISQTVTFTAQQKKDMVDIYTKFYEDVRAQQAFRDQTKLAPLEKGRDAKVEKLLNNPKLYKQYSDAVVKMKAQFQEHQGQPRQH